MPNLAHKLHFFNVKHRAKVRKIAKQWQNLIQFLKAGPVKDLFSNNLILGCLRNIALLWGGVAHFEIKKRDKVRSFVSWNASWSKNSWSSGYTFIDALLKKKQKLTLNFVVAFETPTTSAKLISEHLFIDFSDTNITYASGSRILAHPCTVDDFASLMLIKSTKNAEKVLDLPPKCYL